MRRTSTCKPPKYLLMGTVFFFCCFKIHHTWGTSESLRSWLWDGEETWEANRLEVNYNEAQKKPLVESIKKTMCWLPDGKADLLLNFRANLIFGCHQQLPKKQSWSSNDVSIPFSLWAEKNLNATYRNRRGISEKLILLGIKLSLWRKNMLVILMNVYPELYFFKHNLFYCVMV